MEEMVLSFGLPHNEIPDIFKKLGSHLAGVIQNKTTHEDEAVVVEWIRGGPFIIYGIVLMRWAAQPADEFLTVQELFEKHLSPSDRNHLMKKVDLASRWLNGQGLYGGAGLHLSRRTKPHQKVSP